jgi:hypothetical protein
MPLDTTLSDEAQLNKKVFEAAKRLNNVLLKEGINIVQAIRNAPAWEAARVKKNPSVSVRLFATSVARTPLYSKEPQFFRTMRMSDDFICTVHIN